MEPLIRIENFNYDLPDHRIPAYPLPNRDGSKLLLYNKGVISEDAFVRLPDHLPDHALMVFNNTKVVPARLFFQKETGAMIEIFCLEPVTPADYNISFATTQSCVWRTVVGNAKKWKNGLIRLYSGENNKEVAALNLQAEMLEREANSFVIRFTWETGVPFSRVLELCGQIPIPPYLNRETEAMDLERYQTLYAKFRGSVAAPTAGLHFTEPVLQAIDAKGIRRVEVCLHVGAGTFMPVKSEYIADHQMHSEPFVVTRKLLEDLLKQQSIGPIVAVGTTSVRTLESLYFLGKHCFEATPQAWVPDSVAQWEPYQDAPDGENGVEVTLEESLHSLLEYMKINNLDEITARTRIIIVPGYRFRIVDALVTNFHQPQSTLLLLISAFLGGGDRWKSVYAYALENDFRFLSYGDSSLLIRDKHE